MFPFASVSKTSLWRVASSLGRRAAPAALVSKSAVTLATASVREMAAKAARSNLERLKVLLELLSPGPEGMH